MIFFDAYSSFGPRPRTHGRAPWTLEHLTEELEVASISGAMVACTMQRQHDAMYENRRLADTLAPYDYLYPIWVALPHQMGDFPAPAELVREMAERDVRMAAIFPREAEWSPFAEWNRPLFRALSDAALPVAISCPDQMSPDEVDRLAREWPSLPIVLTHLPWSISRTIFPLLVHRPNVHITLSHFQVHRGIEKLVEMGCGKQLLFNANAPEMSAGAHRAYIDYAAFGKEERAAVAGGNLSRLLKGLRPPRERRYAQEDEIMAAAREGRPMPCLTIDMHAHILWEGHHNVGVGSLFQDGGPRGQAEMAKRMGVSEIGIMSWNGTVGAEAAAGNTCVTAALDVNPELFFGLATFDVAHLDRDTLRRQLEEVFTDKRFLGLKPYPTYGLRYDDPRYDVWWEFGNERGLYAGFHPLQGNGPGEFISVADRFPDLTVMAYHAGGNYERADFLIEAARRCPNIMFEPTYTPVCGGIIEYLVEGVGPDRVCYGTDQPMRDPRQQLGWVVYTRLPVETKRKILGLNAKRLLDGIRQRQAAW